MIQIRRVFGCIVYDIQDQAGLMNVPILNGHRSTNPFLFFGFVGLNFEKILLYTIPLCHCNLWCGWSIFPLHQTRTWLISAVSVLNLGFLHKWCGLESGDPGFSSFLAIANLQYNASHTLEVQKQHFYNHTHIFLFRQRFLGQVKRTSTNLFQKKRPIGSKAGIHTRILHTIMWGLWV